MTGKTDATAQAALIFQPDNANVQPEMIDLTTATESETADLSLLPLDVLSGKPTKSATGTPQRPATLDLLAPQTATAVTTFETPPLKKQANPALAAQITTADDTSTASEIAALATDDNTDLTMLANEPAIELIASLEAMAPISLSEPSQAIAPELPDEASGLDQDLRLESKLIVEDPHAEITQAEAEEIVKNLTETDRATTTLPISGEAANAAKLDGTANTPVAVPTNPDQTDLTERSPLDPQSKTALNTLDAATASQFADMSGKATQSPALRPEVSTLSPKSVSPETIAQDQNETTIETVDTPDTVKTATAKAVLSGTASDQALAIASGQINRAEFAGRGTDKITSESAKPAEMTGAATHTTAPAVDAEARQSQTGGQGAQQQNRATLEMSKLTPETDAAKTEIRFNLEGTSAVASSEADKAAAATSDTALRRPEAMTAAQTEMTAATDPDQETASELLVHPQQKADTLAAQSTHNTVHTGELRGAENAATTAASNAAFAAPRNLQMVDAEWPGKLTAMIREAHEMGQHEIEIALQPEKLGRMTIRLDLRDNNNVAVNIVTESDAAAKMLNDTQSRLADMMQKAGFDMTQHQANSGQGFQGQTGQGGQGGHSSQNSQSGPSQQQAEQTADVPPQSTQTNPENGIDIVA
ncbi:flagellar hook-length control protein FliK [Thalassovita gelatinovora]|uniref:flagellar hook-length control protein FliK n=1 Tax=Thalassovita gelatinovora TaxID=53501 RepID=UPI00130D4FA5|nr:flagellar hook-length control protein FliK [Thalassovita gelatinovora]QIZ82405.1 flagellar hook-length control protein FliK [Thalassovita gelatinovora]